MAVSDSTDPAAGDPPRRGQQRNAGFAPWDDPDAAPLIEFEGVSKSYGDTLAVDDLSLAIYPREFFALLGPSGCGKTTLMRLLAGFETPSAGSVRLEGQDLAEVPPHERPINMMFQSYALFPHLSVWDNIAFGLRRDGLAKAEIARRVEEMLTLVQLTSQGRRKPHQLSGGQRQRVALARSLAKRPRVLLLDEPLRLRAGQEAARRDAVRADEPAGGGGHHLPHRHARPGRGDGPRGPHRHHARGPHRAGRTAAAASTRRRRAATSPTSWAT